MRPTYLIFLYLFISYHLIAQEKLEVDGAIIIKNSEAEPPVEGTIRYNSATKDFEGWNGTAWVSLTRAGDGSIGMVYDVDGNAYRTVQIGSQVWMVENLKTTRYANGDPLIDGTGAGDITGDYTTKYMFDFDDTPANTTIYGKLYTWAAVMNGSASSNSNPSGVQGVCPIGWHVPSDAEWNQLISYLDPEAVVVIGTQSTVAGGMLKETSLAHWDSPNLGATNESGFTGLPGGFRSTDGTFTGDGSVGFWRSSRASGNNAWSRVLNKLLVGVLRHKYSKEFGNSVRCVRDD